MVAKTGKPLVFFAPLQSNDLKARILQKRLKKLNLSNRLIFDKYLNNCL